MDCLSEKGGEEDYYHAKKVVPMTVLAFSVFATLLNSISFLTLVENAYTDRFGTLVWQFHPAGSLGSGSIHYLIQYECNCDLLEVRFCLVKDSLVAKYPVLCHSRSVLASLPLTHECRKNGLTALWV